MRLVVRLGRCLQYRLAPHDVQRWFAEHQEHVASARSIRYAPTVLRAALNQARKWRFVAENVAELVEPPRYLSREIRPLMPERRHLWH